MTIKVKLVAKQLENEEMEKENYEFQGNKLGWKGKVLTDPSGSTVNSVYGVRSTLVLSLT